MRLLVGWKSFPVRTLLSTGMTELFPTIRMEREHSVEGSFSREFSSIYIVNIVYRAFWSRKSSAVIEKRPFLEKRPLAGRFSKFRSARIHCDIDPRTVCNFVKFGRPKIGKVVRYLPHQKQNFGSLSRSRVCADLAQNLPGQRQTMYSQCPQISSKSVHFRWSYSRSNAPQSVSSTPRSFSFFAE